MVKTLGHKKIQNCVTFFALITQHVCVLFYYVTVSFNSISVSILMKKKTHSFTAQRNAND